MLLTLGGIIDELVKKLRHIAEKTRERGKCEGEREKVDEKERRKKKKGKKRNKVFINVLEIFNWTYTLDVETT